MKILSYLIAVVIGAIAGAGILALVFFVTNPIPSSLVCSLDKERKIVNCVDQNGKSVKPPHTVQIR